LKEEKQVEVDPKLIRIREMFSKSPSTVFCDSKTLQESSKYLFNGKVLGIQELTEVECKNDEEDLVFFVQQYFPSKYQFGQKIEVNFREDTPIEELKEMISKRFDIKNPGIVKTYGSWPGPDILDVAEHLHWDAPIPNYPHSSFKPGLLGTAPLYLKDGDILYFKDNDEPTKELTPEEKKALEKEANKTKRNTYYAKEEALIINAKV